MTRYAGWTRDPANGWRLNDTDLLLDFDPLDNGGPLRGAWVLYRESSGANPLEVIDHYLEGAMQWVEEQVSGGHLS